MITIEDLALFLNLDLTSEITYLLDLISDAFTEDSKFEDLLTLKDIRLQSLHQMKVTQYWLDKYLGEK